MIPDIEICLHIMADMHDLDAHGFDDISQLIKSNNTDELFEDDLEYISAASANYQNFLNKFYNAND